MLIKYKTESHFPILKRIKIQLTKANGIQINLIIKI